ncbi:MAG: hypothetical protein MRERV_79c003 [Mycoplasmataceae bacterium RV_VA103A]|nr:MAG: hypothetical protein MRERV_79c003 [Mycoplasmataceae bacterium RV_VA103A]
MRVFIIINKSFNSSSVKSFAILSFSCLAHRWVSSVCLAVRISSVSSWSLISSILSSTHIFVCPQCNRCIWENDIFFILSQNSPFFILPSLPLQPLVPSL